MSAREARILQRLAAAETVLAHIPDGRGWGVYRGADRRRRPRATAPEALAQALLREGALEPSDRAGELRLSAAGRARLARGGEGEADFPAQHRGERARATLLCGLTRVEEAALRRFVADVEAGQAGLATASDWTAPPRGSAPRGGPGEAMDRGYDARRRTGLALRALAPPLAELLRAALIEQERLEAIERRRGWPVRSGRVALRCALAQLAHHYREAAPVSDNA